MEYIKDNYKVKITKDGLYMRLKIYTLSPYETVYENDFLPICEDNARRIADQRIEYYKKRG